MPSTIVNPNGSGSVLAFTTTFEPAVDSGNVFHERNESEDAFEPRASNGELELGLADLGASRRVDGSTDYVEAQRPRGCDAEQSFCRLDEQKMPLPPSVGRDEPD